MIGIVCLEERRGMQFGGRRVSRDRVVTEKICELCEGKTLWMNPASEKLFAEQKESGKVTLQAAADFSGAGRRRRILLCGEYGTAGCGSEDRENHRFLVEPALSV